MSGVMTTQRFRFLLLAIALLLLAAALFALCPVSFEWGIGNEGLEMEMEFPANFGDALGAEGAHLD